MTRKYTSFYDPEYQSLEQKGEVTFEGHDMRQINNFVASACAIYGRKNLQIEREYKVKMRLVDEN